MYNKKNYLLLKCTYISENKLFWGIDGFCKTFILKLLFLLLN